MAAAFFLCLVLAPGYVLSRALLPRVPLAERAALTAGLGVASVSWLMLGLAYLLRIEANGLLLLVSGVVVLLTGGLAWWWRRGAAQPRPSGEDTAVLGVCVAVGMLAFFSYDAFLFQYGSCLSGDVLTIAGRFDDLTARPWSLEDLSGGQRLGAIAWPLPTTVAFGVDGFRLLYALDRFVLAGATAGLLRALTGSARWAAVGALVMTLNPYVFQVPVVDENVITLTLVTLVLYVLFCDLPVRARPAVVGVLAALVIANRHVLLLGLGGLLLPLLPGRDRRGRSMAWFAAGLLVALVPVVVHHLSFFEPGVWESRYSEPAHGGLPIPVYEFLNWPLHDRLVRTPFNPFPTAILFPLRLVQELGLVLVGAAALGAIELFRRRRVAFWSLVLLAAPTMACLSLLEQWTKPNKAGIPLIVLTPVVVGAVLGLKRVAEGPIRRRLVELAASAVLAAVVVLGLAEVHATADARSYERSARQGRQLHTERSTIVDRRRLELVSIAPWPSVSSYARYSPFLAGWKFGLADLPVFPTRLGDRDRKAPRGAAVILHLTVDKERAGWIERGTQPVLWLEEARPYLVDPLQADWTPDTLRVILLRRSSILFVLTVYDNLAHADTFSFQSEIQILFPGHRTPPDLVPTPLLGAKVLEIEAGGISHVVAIDVLSNADEMFHTREAFVGNHPGPVRTGPPYELYLP